MAGLTPQPLPVLLARALAELEARRTIFDLPLRSVWRPREGLDLSVPLPGGRAASPLGPAAGPHTQLAQNLALGWLAGARVLELKTVQVNDRLSIPRPCIDAPDVGYNVEWSQELAIEDSTAQYLAGWFLIHALRARGLGGDAGTPLATRFDASVGYDLEGIRSARVARFLDTLADAGSALRALREALPRGLRAAADVEVPTRVVASVTLSTFHGCPAEEIERIVEHLFTRHGLHVVVKLNPTLLGYEAVDDLLHARLGYDDIVLDRAAFDGDLRWPHALGMLERLARTAERLKLTLGAKLSNTLVVRNTRGTLAGEVVYLSGPPLHPIAVSLADRLARATGGRIPLSFSAGITAENFADAVACGFAPVTTCTDLLKPTGYRRLPRYLRALEEAMERAGTRDLPSFVLARAGHSTPEGAARDPAALRAAALANLAGYAARAAGDPGYRAASRLPAPARTGPLRLLDCAACNNCLLVCPNDAFFSLPIPPTALDAVELVAGNGTVRERAARFETRAEKQWAVFADFCNDCGNCDTFCPESGGPFRVKPRFHGTREAFEAAAPRDGILLDADGARVLARLGGATHTLVVEGGLTRFSDGVIECVLDPGDRVVSCRVLRPAPGHALPLARYHALRALREAVLAGFNPVSAPRLPALRDDARRAADGGR
jgi:putative selenate reductase